MPDISYVPSRKGGWMLLVRGEIILAIDIAPDSPRVADLWTVMTRGAGAGEVLDEVIRTGISKAPSFLLVGGGEATATTVLVRGNAVVRTSTASGLREISGEGVSSWNEQLVDLSAGLEVWPSGVHDDVATLPLGEGVVWAAAFRSGRRLQPAADAEPIAPKTVVPPPIANLVPEAPPVPADASFGSDPEQTLASQTLTTSPTVAVSNDGPADTGYDHLFGETVHRSVEDAAIRSEGSDLLGIVGPPPPAAPESGDHDGHTVLVSDLAALRAKRRAARGAGSVPAAPTLYLELSTGGRELLDQPLVIGRAPTASRVSGSQVPRLVSMNTPNQDISRTHAQITVEGGTVVVTDLHSSNGTMITLPGRAAQKLRPGEPASIIVGTVIDLGDGATLTLGESS